MNAPTKIPDIGTVAGIGNGSLRARRGSSSPFLWHCSGKDSNKFKWVFSRSLKLLKKNNDDNNKDNNAIINYNCIFILIIIVSNIVCLMNSIDMWCRITLFVLTETFLYKCQVGNPLKVTLFGSSTSWRRFRAWRVQSSSAGTSGCSTA